MDGACSTDVEKNNVIGYWWRKPEGKRPLGRPRLRWVHNIKTDLGRIEWASVDWISSSQDRDKWRALVNSMINLRVP
jgi:hypothetical protein